MGVFRKRVFGNLGPIKRHRSERYVLISLVTFALTVLALRGILMLTGYAQIGSDSVHIAHVLWGGLALFAAALLLLVVTNRWALVLGAVLSGGGMGFFSDEVGKFVTRSNNYFTPAAAPIIYALFLATVLVYLRVRRLPGPDTRGEMCRALEQMPGVLDRDMSRHDLNALACRLEQVRGSAQDEALRRLVAAMLAFIETERPRVVEPQPGRMLRSFKHVHERMRGLFTRSRLRILLIVVLLAGGLYAVLDMTLLASLTLTPSVTAMEFLRPLVSPLELVGLGDKLWFSAEAALEGSVGFAMLAGCTLIVLRREWRGVGVAIAGLIADLAVVDLLVFYQDPFRALIRAALQYMVLVAAFSYRRTYLEKELEESRGAGIAAPAELPKAPPGAAVESAILAARTS
ncbi:MAG: hypothetical protein V1912_04210 [bacterium]